MTAMQYKSAKRSVKTSMFPSTSCLISFDGRQILVTSFVPLKILFGPDCVGLEFNS